MNLKFSLFLFFGFIFFGCTKDKTQMPVETETIQIQFSDSVDAYCNSMITVNNQFLFIAGYNTSSNGNKDFMLMKIDLNGKLIWKKNYGTTTNNEICFSIKQISTGLLLIGKTSDPATLMDDMFLVKTDLDGNELWEKQTTTTASDEATDAIELPNGNLMVCGSSRAYDTGTRSAYWTLNDENDNLISVHHTGTGLEDGATKIILNTNHLPVMLAWTDSGQIGGRDFWLIACNDTGGIRWQKQLGNSGYEQTAGICLMNDGGFFMTGHSASFTEPEHDMYELRTDSTGNMQWQTHVGGMMHDGAEAALIASNNHLLMLGRTMSFGNGGNDFFFTVSDDAGNILSQETFGTANEEEGTALAEANGYYFLAGNASTTSSLTHQVYLVKVKAE